MSSRAGRIKATKSTGAVAHVDSAPNDRIVTTAIALNPFACDDTEIRPFYT